MLQADSPHTNACIVPRRSLTCHTLAVGRLAQYPSLNSLRNQSARSYTIAWLAIESYYITIPEMLHILKASPA